MKPYLNKVGIVVCALSAMHFSSLLGAENNIHISVGDSSDKGRLADVSKVYVNIKEVILKVSGGSSDVRVASSVGRVDLLSLSNEINMEVASGYIGSGTVTQVRMVLEESGNSITYSDGSTCELDTPSQQQTGLKVVNPSFSIEAGVNYSLVLNFNAERSLVLKGNGGCTLKPVLKWGGVESIESGDGNSSENDSGNEVVQDSNEPDENENENVNNEEERDDLYDGTEEGLIDCNKVGFDLFDSSTYPDDYNFEDYKHCY